MNDEMLLRLNEHAARGGILGGPGPSEHFADLGLRERDLILTNHNGYFHDEVERALSVCKGEPLSPSPCLVEQLRASLYVLGDSRSSKFQSLYPEIIPGAQRILNDLLLEYPVLMHPRLQVHVYADGNPGICSVPHAIAMAKHGRFPMEGDPGVTKERLTRWMHNAMVYLGFTTVAIPVNDQTTPVVKGSRPIEAAAKQHRAMHWLLASADQLFDIRKTEPEQRNGFADYLLPSDYRGKWSGAGLEAHTSSFFGACGIIDGSPCPAFFGTLKRVRYGENEDLRGSVVNNSVGYILAQPESEIAGSITSRFDAIVKGMVECNFAPGPVEAAQMLWTRITDRSTRQVDVGEAFEVISSVRAAGAKAAVSPGAFGTASKLEPWMHALRVHEAAQVMNDVIDQGGQPATSSAAGPRRRLGL